MNPEVSFILAEVGTPDQIRTGDLHLERVRSAMLFYVVRYDFKTSRPADLRLFVSVVLTGVVTW